MTRADLQALIKRMNELADRGEVLMPPNAWPTLMRAGAVALADLMVAAEPTEAPRPEGRSDNELILTGHNAYYAAKSALASLSGCAAAERRALYNLGDSDGYARGRREAEAEACDGLAEIIRLKGALEAASPQATPAPTANEALVCAGRRLANCAYNLAQSGLLDESQRRALFESQQAWDTALEASRSPAPTASAAPTATPNDLKFDPTPEMAAAYNALRSIAADDQRARVLCWFCRGCSRYVGPGDSCHCENDE